MWLHLTKASGDPLGSDERHLQRELTPIEHRFLTLADELIRRVERRGQKDLLRNMSSIAEHKEAA